MKNGCFFKNLKIVFSSFILMGILTACSGREKQKNIFMASNSSFFVEEITKPSNLSSITPHTKEGIPDSFTVNLRTCIKDALRKDVSLQDTTFVIEYKTNAMEPDEDSKRSQTQNKNQNLKREVVALSDPNGCIQWQEKYKYRFVKTPLWLGLTRTIRTKNSAYLGQVTIPIAVNPWLTESDDDHPPILDIRPQYSGVHDILNQNKYLQEGLQFLSKSISSEEHPQLWVPEVEIQIKEDSPFQAEKILEESVKTNEESEKERAQGIQTLLEPYKKDCQSEDDDCYKRHLVLDIIIPLKLRGYNTQNIITDQELNGGVYDVDIQLVMIPYADRDKTYRIHEKNCTASSLNLNKYRHQQTKFISLQCPIKIAYFNQNAIYKLLIQVKPADKKLPFKLFQGTYTLKEDFKQLTADKTKVSIDNELDRSYQRILDSEREIDIFSGMAIKSTYELIKSESTLSNISGNLHKPTLEGSSEFKFSHVNNAEICNRNETVVKRSVTFLGSVCLKDTLNNRLYRNTPFRVFVKKPDSYIREVWRNKERQEMYKTDNEGCISMPISLEHKVYDRQKYFAVDVHFLSEGSNLYGKVTLALSPWQRAFQAFQDISKLDRNEIRFSTKGVPRPELITNRFRSINQFPSYGLDKFLNINLFHSLYILFQPFIRRPDNIALGLDHRSRELLRDGYYIVRMLLLRNPQETLGLRRLFHQASLDERMKGKLNKELNLLDMSEFEYIAHSDSVVKAEANFVNLYMPLYVTSKQFYYVASRNFLAIEIMPTDPSEYVFKTATVGEQKQCELDFEKTKWKPYRNHDLINRPYMGVFNIQNWINWNILGHAEQLNSDEIIEKSKIGREFKHFSIHDSSGKLPKAQASSSVCVNEVQSKSNNQHWSSAVVQLNTKGEVVSWGDADGTNQKLEEEQFSYVVQTDTDGENPLPPTSDQIKKCAQESRYSNVGSQKEVFQNQTYRDEVLNLNSQKILENFSNSNALKMIELDKPEGHRFIKDINKAISKIGLETFYLQSSEILPLLPSEDQKVLKLEFEKNCSDWFWGYWQDKACRHKILQTYIDKKESEYTALSHTEETGFEKIVPIAELLENIKSTESYINFAIASQTSKNEEILKDIIDTKISQKTGTKPEVLKFTRSLCQFWFDSYLKDYLDEEQMLSAYTNYIRKFDYYKVLQTDGFSDQEKLAAFGNLARAIGLSDQETESESEKHLAQCHSEYVQCVGADYCRDSLLNNVKQDYCQYFPAEENSCKDILNQECKDKPSFALCNKKIGSCNQSLQSFCAVNLDHSICYKFSDRCLVNYSSCIQSDKLEEIFDPSKVVNFECISGNYEECPSYQASSTNPAFVNPESIREHQKKLFELARAINSSSIVQSCLNNPYQFFKFENKMAVYELSKNHLQYDSGYMFNFNVTGNFSLGSYMNWTAQRAASASVSAKVDAGLPADILSGGLGMSLSHSMSSNESNSSRRAVDVRGGEGAFFAVARATFNIGVTKFQKCLVVKPRPNAFFRRVTAEGLFENLDDVWKEDIKNQDFKKIFVSRPGLVLCKPMEQRTEENPEVIKEDYYYISQNQVDPSNSQFLNLYDLINRPFVNILRGRREFVKYYFMMKNVVEGDNGNINENLDVLAPPENMFVNYSFPVEEAVGLSLAIREFNETGFHPGIYDYSDSSDEELDTEVVSRRNSWSQNLFHGFRDNVKFLDIPSTPRNEVPIQDY